MELAPVLVRDLEDRIIYWSQGAESMYGFTKEQALGRTGPELLQTRFAEPLDGILSKLRSGKQWQGELSHTRSDQTEILVTSQWVPYCDPNGALEAIIEVDTDITARRQAEAQADIREHCPRPQRVRAWRWSGC